ncbi:unnamed protein product [Symbiodinium pilosum]|uniref:SET domain-containing protein n=1 Tax=Symbiodinium pilosum TaxID=2952 RepID=A0A812T9I2_SYMPI|nr:unnamed protein product [Symbiodinium pilosum]
MPWWKVKRASLENSSMVGIAEMAQDGRGRRLVAAQDILKGTEIFMESPVLWVAQEAGMEEVAAQLQDLTPAVQDSLLQLCQSSSLPPEELAIIEELASGNDQLFALLRVYLINSIGTPDGGSAIYLKASRANHSCRPNAAFQFDKERQLRLVTLRPVPSGEEVLVSYLPEGQKWGFRCRCCRCQTPDDVRPFVEEAV